MQDDLALKIVIALREEINRHPEIPADEELADVVRPMLPDPAEVAQVLKWGVDLAEDPSKSAVWPLANDIEPTKGKWRRYDPTIWGLPTHPSTQKLPWDKLRDPITDGPECPSTQELYDAAVNIHFFSVESGSCPADGCKGVLFRNPINNAGWCTCCGRGFAPTQELYDDPLAGILEGETCNRRGCQGVMAKRPDSTVYQYEPALGFILNGTRRNLQCSGCGCEIHFDPNPTDEAW